MPAVSILLIILFNSKETLVLITECLYIFGLVGIFRKCGTRWWYALIPCYRMYVWGKCVGHESDGKTLFVLDLIIRLLNILLLFMNDGDLATALLIGLNFAVALIHMVYDLRIISGIRELFQLRKRIWVLLWLILEGPLAAYFGWNPKKLPTWTVEDLSNEAADFFSGQNAAVMDQGLTVNLDSRTVTEFFSKKHLLRDVHMYIQPGHMVLLLGGSGAGKTTLLNAITGYEKAKAQISLNGHDVYDEYKKMQYDIGFVPQQDLMRENDTVLFTLSDAARLRLPRSFTGAERQERVRLVMEIFGLTPVQNSLLSKLSGGQRKRLSIALEFISNPALFILDEPDSGLDGVMARELMEQLRNIADQGKIVIVITHTPDRVIDLFDDVIVLAKDSKRTGRLAWYGPVDEARSFFGCDSMEEIVLSINRKEEGGLGRADEFIMKYAEVQHG